MNNEEASQVWFLRILDDPDSEGRFVRTIESVGDSVLAYLSEEEAIVAAKYHRDGYDIKCRPFRVK